MEDELGFQGGATFYQSDSKVDVEVRMYFATDATGSADRWWGEYEILGGVTLASGEAYGRFSEGSEAEIAVDVTDDRTGRFVLTSPLADSTRHPPN